MTTKVLCDGKVKVTICRDITGNGVGDTKRDFRRISERQYWKYRLYWNKELIFSGNDFSGPMFYTPLKALYELLGFLTLQPGDTDKEYFANYTERQLEFCYSVECEEIRLYLYDKEF